MQGVGCRTGMLERRDSRLERFRKGGFRQEGRGTGDMLDRKVAGK